MAKADSYSIISSSSWGRHVSRRTDRQTRPRRRTAHLERKTEITAVRISDLCGNLTFCAAAEDDRGAGALGHEARSFEVGFLEVEGPGALEGDGRGGWRAWDGACVENLALCDIGNNTGCEFDDTAGSEAGDGCGRAGKEKVAGEDREFVAEHGSGSGEAGSWRGWGVV